MTKFSDLPTKITVDPGDYFAIDDVSTNTSKKITQATLATSLVNATSGWNNLGYAPNTITCNGNRSYSLVFNTVDLTSTISPGMRLKTTRSVAAPTQCTSLNGTTQYYSKTSPAGMTFTDTWTTAKWIKLTSYGAYSTIDSRYNGSSGFQFAVTASGQLVNQGNNGSAANYRNVTSYQTIPLNKWVHVASSFSMSGFTNATCKIFIDGVEVPSLLGSGGTSPTALVQAGNYEIGSQNGGTTPFPGKIAQSALFSAVISQATLQSYISQGYAGTETSLISAHSFSGSITDLNTTNANNLTANGSALATTADSPFGGQAGGLISSTLDYGIIQRATFSTNTTIVVQASEGCTIPTSGGIGAVSYATVTVPYGFPRQKEKWRLVSILAINNVTNSPTSATWYPMNEQIVLPIGEWSAGYESNFYALGSSSNIAIEATLSTSISAESDKRFSAEINAASVNQLIGYAKKDHGVSIASATPYYFLVRYVAGTVTGIGVIGADVQSILIADNAYL